MNNRLRIFTLWGIIIAILLAGLAAWLRLPGWILNRLGGGSTSRDDRVIRFILDSGSYPDWAVPGGTRCGDAPFLFPTSGYIGYLWDDSFRPGHRHSGLDIFAGTQPGETPVYAAASGYLTREADWRSSLIIRIPEDPLNPSRQIWMYYTHMADPMGNSLIVEDFAPGSQEVYVEAGTLLGYQGNYSGRAGAPVGVHLHFSVVKDDGSGHYTNELDIENTIDPSPYLGIIVNAQSNPADIPLCPTPTGGGPE
jgi:peptidoglycan LD-endopeptidase LytH